jgi:hypothetical protein
MKNPGEGVIIVNQMSGSTATPDCALPYLWWDSQPPLHRNAHSASDESCCLLPFPLLSATGQR